MPTLRKPRRVGQPATQQLIYTLGSAEWSLTLDEDQERLFEQYRRYASVNLRALLSNVTCKRKRPRCFRNVAFI